MDTTFTPEQHIERWQTSGHNQREYCRQNGVNPNTFVYWLRRNREKSAVQKQNWVKLKNVTEKARPARHLELRLNLGFFRIEYTRSSP